MSTAERMVEVTVVTRGGAQRTVMVPVESLNTSAGTPGPKGDPGDTGPRGLQGPQGIQGPPGPQGEPGTPGQNGAQGLQGERGLQGDAGPQGVKGDTGAEGPRGLQGDQGPTGPQGLQGPQGNAGAQGIQGIQGPAGVDGVRTATTAFGYSTGAGGTITQSTNKSTAVTLNKLCGTITMSAAALAAGAIVTFTFNNNTLAAGDVIVTNHISGGTVGPYLITPRVTGAGIGTVTVRNTSAGSLSEAIVIGFAVVKAVTA